MDNSREARIRQAGSRNAGAPAVLSMMMTVPTTVVLLQIRFAERKGPACRADAQDPCGDSVMGIGALGGFAFFLVCLPSLFLAVMAFFGRANRAWAWCALVLVALCAAAAYLVMGMNS